MERRTFLRNTGLTTAGLALLPPSVFGAGVRKAAFISQRPPVDKRRFISAAVEAKIAAVKRSIKDEELAWMFENCYPNTLDTTVTVGTIDNKPDTYVITGDIDAMWLRDSAVQVWPYLPLMKEDKALENLVQGVINRQARCVLIDPYANAFYKDATQKSDWQHHETDMKPGVHERKWEVDSLCYVIRLAYGYWAAGGNPACFDAEWLEAMKLIVKTFGEQQRKTGNGPYRFRRTTNRPTDTAASSGYGNLVKPVGLICSVFRPSDDGTVFPFLIPSNYFAVVSLQLLAMMVNTIYSDNWFTGECYTLAAEVQQALKEHAIVDHKTFGKILAYEVDGFGGHYLADDSNVPSLLSLPYLGAVGKADEALYKRTRRFVLSAGDNSYYVKGKVAEGISGPHAGRDNIWPMSIMMRAMTSDKDKETINSLRMLKATHAGTGFMHKSFNKDDATRFTRKWFAWANTLFGELIIKTADEKPHLLA